MAKLSPRSTEDEDLQWTLHVDGSSNDKSCRARVVLEGPGNILLEQSLKLVSKTSNNQAKYKVILVGLNLAYDMKGQQLLCRSNSQLVVEQLKGEFKVKESLVQKYYHFVQNLMSKLKNVHIEHIQREHDVRADMLSRLATTKKKGLQRSVIYVILRNPTVSTDECMAIVEKETWMIPIRQFLEKW